MAPLVECVMVAFASVFRDSNMFLVFSCYFDDFLVISGVSAFTKTAHARFNFFEHYSAKTRNIIELDNMHCSTTHFIIEPVLLGLA